MKNRILAGALASAIVLAPTAVDASRKQKFPCREEDEAKITFVTPRGNRSICLPADNISIGIFDSSGNIVYETSVDHYPRPIPGTFPPGQEPTLPR